MPRHAAFSPAPCTTDSAALEQAARAAYIAHYQYHGIDVTDPEHGIPWERLNPKIKFRFLAITRAALDAYLDAETGMGPRNASSPPATA